MTKKNKNQQKEGGGFIKKVSSLFNLDTVNLSFLHYFLLFAVLFCFDLINNPNHLSLTLTRNINCIELNLTASFVFNILLIPSANRSELQNGH